MKPSPQNKKEAAMDATRRFSDRVADYRRYRPGYPPQLVDDLLADGKLPAGGTVADIGSGTGLLARLFLERGHAVIGIESNLEMRAAGEEELRSFPNFKSLDGTAEATTLVPVSVDLVTAGQAFHWFDRAKTKQEFQRILRPGGSCVLIWNDRHTDTTPFLAAYEKLLQDFSTDYSKVDHKQITDEVLVDFYAPQKMTSRIYPNCQLFDFEGLKGRLLSSSYAPPPGHPSHAPMLARLADIFQKYKHNDQVIFEYETKIYAGRL
jgi:SAM-dependent methyltransferase